jgi:hypothetical protein
MMINESCSLHGLRLTFASVTQDLIMVTLLKCSFLDAGAVRACARIPVHCGVRARHSLQPPQHTRPHAQGPQEQPHQPHSHRSTPHSTLLHLFSC